MCTYIFFALNSYPMDPVSLNPTQAIQHYVIKFVSDLRQVGGFLHQYQMPCGFNSCSKQLPFWSNFCSETGAHGFNSGPNSYPVNPIFSLKIYLWVHFYSINDSYPMYPIFALKNAVFKSNMASNTGHRAHLMRGISRII